MMEPSRYRRDWRVRPRYGLSCGPRPTRGRAPHRAAPALRGRAPRVIVVTHIGRLHPERPRQRTLYRTRRGWRLVLTGPERHAAISWTVLPIALALGRLFGWL